MVGKVLSRLRSASTSQCLVIFSQFWNKLEINALLKFILFDTPITSFVVKNLWGGGCLAG